MSHVDNVETETRLRRRARLSCPPQHFSGPLINENVDLEDFPDQFETLTKGVTTFMKYLSEFPEFTDKAVNASIADGCRETSEVIASDVLAHSVNKRALARQLDSYIVVPEISF
ncbi:uncharacterized protein ARMOST_14920 [Armillaria ostoyae]|uniref:Uncharacterized protein n=1 Tax=Armillaria ostoyae TaxID=47428 RepID=A0A284RRX8_ARMOS|nr:uncharacterized protein ARMOST_14920 [Armillaria ostoyae]